MRTYAIRSSSSTGFSKVGVCIDVETLTTKQRFCSPRIPHVDIFEKHNAVEVEYRLGCVLDNVSPPGLKKIEEDGEGQLPIVLYRVRQSFKKNNFSQEYNINLFFSRPTTNFTWLYVNI